MSKSLSELDQSDLDELRNMAKLMFTPPQIAVMLELDADALAIAVAEENAGTGIYSAFWGGRYECEAEIRASIMKMANAGSTPAQAIALELMKMSKIKMMAQ